ncbi:MAG: dihydrofolate reductase family protein [Gammaproteobacteria bacterium]|nr:dihydrofolate reductase family protein [Gammaproteobacteria bacterium]MDH5628601.1 dihydrofolate reductase family protein [Gammaproteobacteria bacterium]
MNTKFIAFCAVSLDGFLARENGKLDWLEASADKESTEDYGYQKFLRAMDCIVMGRNTFEKVASFAQWPYVDKRVIVLSKKMQQIPSAFEDKISLFSGKVEELVVDLQSRGYKHIYIDGGKTIQSFIRAGVMDELIITQIPILINKGLPLFAEFSHDIKLKLTRSQSYPSGFVQSRYDIEHQSRYYDGE